MEKWSKGLIILSYSCGCKIFCYCKIETSPYTDDGKVNVFLQENCKKHNEEKTKEILSKVEKIAIKKLKEGEIEINSDSDVLGLINLFISALSIFKDSDLEMIEHETIGFTKVK